jgi:hypothetical protein
MDLSKLQGLTVERVARSLRFRAMHLFARFEPVRTVSTMGIRAPRKVASATFPDVSVDEFVAVLKRDGLAPGLTLPDDIARGVRAYADSRPCYGNLNKSWGFMLRDRAAAEERAGTKFTVGHFFNTRESEVVRRLSIDPFCEEVAKRYIGPRAKMIEAHMWWSFAGERSDKDRHTYAQQFHFDLDGYRFLKFFFYLTDVDEESGPHVYVRGSHRGKSLRERFPMRRFSDDEVIANWGEERITHVKGPKGSGFAADTFGIHKGLPPTRRDRLVFEFLWGQHDYGITDDAKPEDLQLLT